MNELTSNGFEYIIYGTSETLVLELFSINAK